MLAAKGTVFPAAEPLVSPQRQRERPGKQARSPEDPAGPSDIVTGRRRPAGAFPKHTANRRSKSIQTGRGHAWTAQVRWGGTSGSREGPRSADVGRFARLPCPSHGWQVLLWRTFGNAVPGHAHRTLPHESRLPEGAY